MAKKKTHEEDIEKDIEKDLEADEEIFQASEKESKAEALVTGVPARTFVDHLRERMQRTHIWTEADEETYKNLQ